MIPYLSEEQLALRHEVRKLLGNRAPMASVRQAMLTDEGYDPGVWRALSADMGLVALAIDEANGGMGPAFIELAIVLEELGYASTPVPFLSTVLAACALESAASRTGLSSDVGAVLTRLAAGEATATLCGADDSGAWTGHDATVTAAVGSAADCVLDGYAAYALDGNTADHLVVVADVDGRRALCLVDRHAAGVRCQQRPTLDQTRRIARITFERSPARLASAVGAEEPIARVLDIASVLISAESLGGARACLEMAVHYAKDRVQFGRPIGSFQAIKFKCADMLVRVDSAASAVFYASRLIGTPDENELPVVASLAKAYCADAFFEVAAENIQIHGGIGFTWEHDAHLYFKRATCSRLLFGQPDQHRELMLQRIGI